MTPDIDRKRIEVTQARRASTTLPEHEQVLFNSLRAVTRSMLYENRTFIVWCKDSPQNKIIDILKVNDIDVGFHDGLAVRFKNSQGDHVWVGHTPTRLFRYQAMAHVPFLPEVKYSPRPNSKVELNELQLPIVIKTLANPDADLKEVQFVTDVRIFVSHNPQYQGRQF